MTDAEKLAALKVLLGNSSTDEPVSDDVLSAYIKQAEY